MAGVAPQSVRQGRRRSRCRAARMAGKRAPASEEIYGRLFVSGLLQVPRHQARKVGPLSGRTCGVITTFSRTNGVTDAVGRHPPERRNGRRESDRAGFFGSLAQAPV